MFHLIVLERSETSTHRRCLNNLLRVWRDGQLVKCVPCKYENLNLVPGSHVKKSGCGTDWLWGGGDRLVNLAKLLGPRSQ